MKKVVVFTKVFRYEPIIERCFQSVLGQTYSNLIYYLWVSEDTLEIARKYAALDSRVRLCTKKPAESKYRTTDLFKEVILEEDADYLCNVDADDYLDVHFIEHMMNFLQENELDIAFSDRAYVRGENRIDVPPEDRKNVISTQQELKDKLPLLYMGVRTIWGTLYTRKILLKADYSYLPDNMRLLYYGGDTQTVICILRACERIGMLNEPLYVYNVEQGISREYFSERRDADVFLYHFAQDFLRDIGAESKTNTFFLNLVLANAVLDTAEVIANSSVEEEKKVADIAYICEKEEVQQAFEFYKVKYDQTRRERMPIPFLLNDRIVPKEISEECYQNLLNIFKCCVPKFRDIFIEDVFTCWIFDFKALEYLYKGNNLGSIAYLLGTLSYYQDRKLLEALCLIERLAKNYWLQDYFADYLLVCDASRIFLDIILAHKEQALEGIRNKLNTRNDFYTSYSKLLHDYMEISSDSE